MIITYQIRRLFVLLVAVILLTACVTSIDPTLPRDALPAITVATDVELIASPAHPTSFLPFDAIAAGDTVSLVGTDEDAAWLLVLAGDRLGWMPTIFSETNVGNLQPAIVGTPLTDACYKYVGALTDMDATWPSNIEGAALVIGSLYRPAVEADFETANLVVELTGPGSVVASDYVHTPLTNETALALFSYSLRDLSPESAVSFALQGGSETPALQGIFFAETCLEDAAKLALGPLKDVNATQVTALPLSVDAAQTTTDAAAAEDVAALPTPLVVASESQPTPTPMPDKRALVPGEAQLGNLAQDEVQRYVLEGHANTPLLLTVERTSGDLCYYVTVLDEYDAKVGEWGRFCDGQQRLPFTPPRTETLTLAVTTERAGGDYSLTVDWLDVSPDKRNQDNAIVPGAQVSGALGVGAWDEWLIEGHENTPLLWQVERTAGDLCYYVTIYDSLEEQLEQWGRFCGDVQKFSFTPPRTETLRVTVYANSNYGNYALGVDWLDGPPDEEAGADIIEDGAVVDGSLGVEAYDDYLINAYENVPLLLTIERTRGDLCYYVNVDEVEGERLKYWGRFCGGQQKFAFTPQRTELLTIRVYADSNFGDYSLLVEWLDSAPEERTQLRSLEPDVEQRGRLGIEAYDDFMLEGFENVPLLFTVERDRGDLCYYLNIYDADDERLAYWGRYCDGQQKIPYTPPRTEALTARVYADSSYGDYTLEADWLDRPPAERNLEPPLQVGAEQSGRLGVGAYDDYVLDGFRNTPMLFTIERTRGDLCYYLSVFDYEDEQLNSWGRYCGDVQKLAFTPPRTEPLTIRVYADSSYGDYALQTDWIDGEPSTRRQTVELEPEIEQSGRLGAGAWNSYAFTGRAGDMLSFTVERTRGDLCYYATLYDAADERMQQWGRFCSGRNDIEYELPNAGDYMLRIYADSSYGDYVLMLE